MRSLPWVLLASAALASCAPADPTTDLPAVDQPRVEQMLRANLSARYRIKKDGSSSIVVRLPEGVPTALPSTLADPHFHQDTEDNGFAPSDFQQYYAFRVAPAELGKWTALLEPRTESRKPDFVSPKVPQPWWVAAEQFIRLEFYEPRPLSGLSNGWCGVDRLTGDVFVYAYKM